jgi:hypothetical protein
MVVVHLCSWQRWQGPEPSQYHIEKSALKADF